MTFCHYFFLDSLGEKHTDECKLLGDVMNEIDSASKQSKPNLLAFSKHSVIHHIKVFFSFYSNLISKVSAQTSTQCGFSAITNTLMLCNTSILEWMQSISWPQYLWEFAVCLLKFISFMD